MSETISSMEVVKLLFAPSLALISVTVVILAHLLAQYARVKPLGEKERKPYFISAILITIVMILDGAETIMALMYVLNAYPPSMVAMWYNLIISLFVLMVVGIVSGAVFLAIKVLG